MDCLSSESSEETELPYGPGIVARLKNRFMKYSMNTDASSYRNGGHAIACTASKVQSRRNALNRHNKLKRCSSVENILDDDAQQKQQQQQVDEEEEEEESDTSTSPITKKSNLIKPRPPFQSIHHSTVPVIKNYFLKSDSPATTTTVTTTTTTAALNVTENEANTAVISTVNCNPLPTERSSITSTSSTSNCPPVDCSTNKQPEKAEASSMSKFPVAAINGISSSTVACVRGDTSTLISSDECISIKTVKKAKSMDSLELQSIQCESKGDNHDDVDPPVLIDNSKRDEITAQEVSVCDARPPPQVPERPSIRQSVRETTKTAVISPVVKSSCQVDPNEIPTVTSTIDSGSTSNVPPPPVASARRRSLTRGTTLPSVKPVIAQKPKSSSEVSSTLSSSSSTSSSTSIVAEAVALLTTGKSSVTPVPMTQRPIPPPRAPKAPVASVSPFPATVTSTIQSEVKSVTNCSQSTVSPVKSTAYTLSSSSLPPPSQPPPSLPPPPPPPPLSLPLPQTLPSASTVSPSVIATQVNGNDNNKNTRNTKDSNNIKNSEHEHSSSLNVSTVKSLTSTNATSVTMAASSLLNKNTCFTNGDTSNKANNCNFNNNMTFNRANNNKSYNCNDISNGRNISTSVNVSNLNNINNNNKTSTSNNSIINGRCNRSRSCTDTTTTQQQLKSPVSSFPLIISNGKDNIESKASIGRSSVINSTNCLVFDFRGKNVQPALAITSPHGRNAYIDSTDVEDEYRGCMDIPAPCNITFQGENEIIGAGSLLRRRDKNLKITFDDTATETYEYPSEQSLLAASDDTETRWDNTPRSGMFYH